MIGSRATGCSLRTASFTWQAQLAPPRGGLLLWRPASRHVAGSSGEGTPLRGYVHDMGGGALRVLGGGDPPPVILLAFLAEANTEQYADNRCD